MSTVISVENLSKVYRLGQIGTGTFCATWNSDQRKLNNIIPTVPGRCYGYGHGNLW
jgi:hypothetical protein